MRLSVLDQSPVSAGSTGGDALRNSIDLARHVEALGYYRYWVAEHHATAMLACASPEVLIPAIAAATSALRVGSGGVMLPHYSPLKVAETFSMLSGLYPKRIDLGLGRAPGSDPVTAFALQRDRRQPPPDDFPDQLTELLAYLYMYGGRVAVPVPVPGTRTATRPLLPGHPERPDVWMLGSSAQSGIWAAELGLPYAFADFINPNGAAIVERYRRDCQSPHVIVCAWALCAATDAEADRLAASARMAFAKLLQGEPIPVPPVDEAVAFLAANGPAADALVRRRRWIVGSPPTVRAGLDALAQEYAADEIMIVTITYDHNARKRSYELIRDAVG